jgi:hypothetical protein
MQGPMEMRAEPSAPSPERDFLLVRMGLGEPDVEVRVTPDDAGIDDGCGGGYWCPAYRVEIKAEAFAWLHELAESHFRQSQR